MRIVFLAALSVLATTAQGQVLTNLAISEHGTVTTIFGYNDGSDLSAFGTEYEQYGGSKVTMNDGVTSGDNANTDWGNDGGQTGTSYGFGGYENLTVPAGMEITSVNLYMNAFGDGGWFGPNGDSYPGGQPLTAAHLAVPLIQITTDGGTTWTTLSIASDNYLSAMETVTPGQGSCPEVTFALSAPVTNADGIRVIGLNGGYAGSGHDADSTSGFMAINELQIEAQDVPEPSTYALMLGAAALLAAMVRRHAIRA